MPRANGLFLALEGPDGSGKTSLRRRFYERLNDLLTVMSLSYLSVPDTALIVGAKYHGREVAPDRLSQAYVRDKQLLCSSIIEPQLRDRHVLSDRYVLSDMVYHEVLWGIPAEVTLHRYAKAGVRFPDLTIFVATSPRVASDRLRQRSAKKLMWWEADDYQRRVHQRFAELLPDVERLGLGQLVVVTNDGSLSATWAQVEQRVMPLLPSLEDR